MNYLRRHWNGDLSLPVAFWLGAPAVFLLVTAAAYLFAWLLALWGTDYQHAVYYVCVEAVVLPAHVWYIVGVWRSAAKRGDGWARAAQAASVLRGAAAAATFFAVLLPTVKESVRFAAEVRQADDFELRLLPGAQELELVGGVGRGLPKAVREALEKNPGVRVLRTNLYRGGRLKEALALNAELRRRGLDTRVTGGCRSACLYVFLGGKRRALRADGGIGVHSPRVPGTNALNEWLLQRRDAAELVSLGVEPGFAKKTVAVAQPKTWHPTKDELLAAGVVTEVEPAVPADVVRPLASEAARARAALLENPAFRALETSDPDAFASVLEGQVVGQAGGQSDETLTVFLSASLMEAFRRALPNAEDAALTRYARFMAEQLRYLERRDPAACLALVKGEAAVIRNPQALQDEDRAVTAAVIASAERKHALPAGAAYRPALERARRNARVHLGYDGVGPLPEVVDANRCAFGGNFYDQLANTPAPDGPAAIRGLLRESSPR